MGRYGRSGRKRHTPARCNTCGGRIVFWRNHNGRWRTYDPTPVNGRTHLGTAHPVWGNRAWRLDDLIEQLMVLTEQSSESARDEAYDVPWYVAHTCPPTTTTPGATDAA